jgi:hypothetical protein
MDDAAILIVNLGSPVAVDYVRHCQHQGNRQVFVIAEPQRHEEINVRLKQLVVFLADQWANRHRRLLEAAIGMARQREVRRIYVVSSWKVHFEEVMAIRAETAALQMLNRLGSPIVIVRPSHVLSPKSWLNRALRFAWVLLPIVPQSLRSCSVGSEEVFQLMETEASRPSPGRCRAYTLLGANLPWRARLIEHAPPACARVLLLLAKLLVPLALFRFMLGWLFSLVAARTPRIKAWHLQTLYPRTRRELLALYNPYNYHHVKIVGYNNGVVHFGQQFPGKTVVSTLGCSEQARVWGDRARFDAGVTLHRVAEVLGSVGRQLHVLPNYSYVSLGTAYFIPIHGSASKYTTIAETIEKVVLYDPDRNRFLVGRRGEPAFAETVYNLTAPMLLLRMVVRTCEKTCYFFRKEHLANPSSQEILAYFHDNKPTNVEIRKAGAAAVTVQVCQYFREKDHREQATLDLPRDALGQLWDRLEENPITSYLFHTLTRLLAYHAELFLSEEEFARFWETHQALPIRKIQLRFIRRDSWPHSPFRDHDCISVDLFMLKKHRNRFESYVKKILPTARTNPGKQGMESAHEFPPSPAKNLGGDS